MGRPKRVEFPGACYLVTLQGHAWRDLFQSSQDRRQFLSLLRFSKEAGELRVYAYALLANRAELLLETPRGGLSAAMQRFNTRYTKYYNAAHNTSGHVLAGRYSARLVDKDAQLVELTRWVHLAPARESPQVRPWRYPWSSCAAYVEAEHKEPLVESAPALRALGRTRLKQSVRYLQSLKQSAREPARVPPPARAPAAPAPAPEPSVEGARRIVADVAARHGLDAEKLLGRLQWRELTPARREAALRLWREAGLGVSAMARLFGRTPSAVSQWLRAAENAASASIN